MDSESANENHTSYSDVPESNPRGEDKEQNCTSLVNPKSSARWLEPWYWHTSNGEEKRVKAMTLYLFGWWKTKSYGNPNS